MEKFTCPGCSNYPMDYDKNDNVHFCRFCNRKFVINEVRVNKEPIYNSEKQLIGYRYV